MVAINGIGPKIAESVHGYFRHESNALVVEKLLPRRCEHGRGRR